MFWDPGTPPKNGSFYMFLQLLQAGTFGIGGSDVFKGLVGYGMTSCDGGPCDSRMTGMVDPAIVGIVRAADELHERDVKQKPHIFANKITGA